MKYDLSIKDKHSRLNDAVELQHRALRKAIGHEIFSTFKIWLKDDETGDVDYYTARKLYSNIVNDEIFIKLKYRLAFSGIIIINELISNEYGTILRLERENENLTRELNYYKKLLEGKAKTAH